MFQRGSRTCRLIAFGVLASLVPLTTVGCYGTFALTKTVYRFNGEIHENPVIQSIVMWLLGLFGIYGIATLIDLIVLNFIEFLTGNEFVIGQSSDGQPLYLQAVRMEVGSSGLMRLNVVKDGATVESHILARDFDGTLVLRSEDGTVAARFVRNEGGKMVATDTAGRVLAMR